MGLPRLEPGAMFAGYRIESVVARGGMGIVYKAADPHLDRVVALKIIAPEFTTDDTAVARFKAEARMAASLEHPNIVPIYAGGEFDGVLYLAMRFVPGTSLRQVIDRGPMALGRVGRIVGDVAAALDAAHARGLVHRDVKPANILLALDGDRDRVYLSDFGITKRLGSTGDLTRPGGWVGTPDYVAPEQIQGGHVDGRADVYSLGCVLFEMLTGHVAFDKPSEMAKLWAHVSDPPPLPRHERPDLVEGFDEAIARATAKDPDQRFGTAGELAAAVSAAIVEQEARERATRAQATRADEDVTRTGAGQATSDEDAAAATVTSGPAPEPREDPAAAPVAARGVPPATGAGVRRSAEPPGGGDGDDGDADRNRGWLSRHGVKLAVAVPLIAGAIVAAFLLTSGDDETPPTPPPAGQRIAGGLTPVPTNRVDASGDAVVRLNRNVATVSVKADGLLDAAPHLMHIHANGRGRCPTAAAARPHNGRLTIATLDGVPSYGGPVTALTLRGDTSKSSILAFARFPKTGRIGYERAIRVSSAVASQLRDNNAVVVIHGIDYNRNGVYDGALDRSDLDRSIPGETTAPALCGPLVAANRRAAVDGGGGPSTAGPVRPGAGGGEAFVASLTPEDRVPVFHCSLRPSVKGADPGRA